VRTLPRFVDRLDFGESQTPSQHKCAARQAMMVSLNRDVNEKILLNGEAPDL